ncbi:Replication factor C (RF-C) subunit [Coelomomyces lativittatus]|nr:Replication factor C (RF-C) subunit [Coelomomyces lativittatus]
MAMQLKKEQSPESLMALRPKFYELLAHCIPPSIIIKTFALSLADMLPQDQKPMVFHEAAFYEHSLRLGNKPIFHLEAFAAKVMSNYKKYRFENNI